MKVLPNLSAITNKNINIFYGFLFVWVSLWSLPIQVYGQEKDISRILWSANWSHDQSCFVVGGVDGKIRIFSGKTFELIRVINNQKAIQRMSWHPERNLLAVAAVEDGSKLIDIDKDTIIFLQGMNSNGSRAIDWNYNGDMLAFADYEGVITLCNQQGELIRSVTKENTKSNVAIDWHPSKNEFIVLSECVRIYDAEGNLLQKFEHRKEDVLLLCVQWHPSGDFFVIGDYGDVNDKLQPLLQFWKSDGNFLSTQNISKSEYRNMSWSKRGNKLATASDALRIWNKKGKLIAEGKSPDNLWGVDWSPDGKYIVTSSFEGHIKIWDKNARLIKDIIHSEANE